MLKALNNLPRDGRDTLFLLAVIAVVVLPQVSYLPWWCSLLAAGVLVWRGVLAWHARPLPPRLWLVLLTTLTLGATWLTHRTLLGREAGVTLIVVLLALKTLELRARRDAYVVFFLGFFTMLTSFFSSQSLLMAAAILLGLMGLLTALVNANMPVGKPPLWHATRTAGWMTLMGAPLMVLLFVLFPRMAPLWGIPGDAASGRSGLSASMQVGQIGSLALDSSIALNVRFEGRIPPQRDLYFRGPVLSVFDGRSWQSVQTRYTASQQPAANLQVLGEPVDYVLTMQPTMRPWLMVLDATPDAPQLKGSDLQLTPDLQWISAQPIAEMVRYKVRSYPQFRHGPPTRDARLQVDLDLPPGFNPRTQALAKELRNDPRLKGGDTSAMVNVVMERLRSGGYVYTLEPGVTGRDSADEFWFDSKQGFCEHIASAFVILMRGMGIPARVVTGYQGGEFNSISGFWVVRQSDAHAWAEVWQSGQGWVRVDPTSALAPGRVGASQRLVAPTGVIAGALNSVLGTVSPDAVTRMRAAWEALNNSWNQWVLDYGQNRQLNLLKDLGFSSPSWEDLVLLLAGLLVISALLGLLWAMWERRQSDPWLRLLHRARQRLAKAGIDMPDNMPPRSVASVLAQRTDAASTEVLRRWLLRMEAQRYAALDGVQARQGLNALQREFGALVWPQA